MEKLTIKDIIPWRGPLSALPPLGGWEPGMAESSAEAEFRLIREFQRREFESTLVQIGIPNPTKYYLTIEAFFRHPYIEAI